MHFPVRPVARFCQLLPAMTILSVVVGCSDSDLAVVTSNAPPTGISATKAESLPGDDALKAKIDEVVDFTERRTMSAKDHAAWQIVHGILAYGRNLPLDVNGKTVSALDYLLDGGQLRGWVFKPGDHGLEAIVEAGSKTGQGHEDQWLGYISQCGVELTQPIKVGDKTYQFGDLLSQAQWDVQEGMEASWTLMALASYVPANSTWKNRRGEEWSVERVIGMEAAQSLSESACGGSHRMGGIAMALNRHLSEGGQLTGGWKAADDKIQDCIRKTQEYQQADGTFSSNYWIRPSTTSDAALRLNTTGHQLEFLALSMSDQQLAQPWVTRAANELCNLLVQTKDMPVECGGLYHAAHGLEIYRLRRFGPRSTSEMEGDSAPAPTTASQPNGAKSS